MLIPFSKYQGTGNDFIMIDQRDHSYINIHDSQQVKFICDRRFGIGGDGLILLEKSQAYDFKMTYFNSDGRLSSMCGNGGRCIVAFANQLGIFEKSCVFEAIDGMHQAEIDNNIVSLKMSDVTEVNMDDDSFLLDTGSPHYVSFAEADKNVDIVSYGRSIRYSDPYKDQGINVNLVKANKHGIEVLTYERGVEDETFSCGTGVTAAAIASNIRLGTKSPVDIDVRGGQLKVAFEASNGTYTNIWLIGPAEAVFTGTIRIQ